LTEDTVTVIPVSIPDDRLLVNPVELTEVLDALRRLDGPHLTLASPPQRLTGGFWAEMWTLTLDNRGPRLPERVVLRLSPDPQLAAWETAVQRIAADMQYPTPAIIAFRDSTDATRFWSVMEHASGQPLLAGLSGINALTKLPQLARRLPDQLASVMAQLHALDPTAAEQELSEIRGGRDGIDGLIEHYAITAERIGNTPIARAIDRLVDTRPPTERLVICHGDLHPFNVLQHNGELTVLDWTAAQIADPTYDVAFTALLLSNPPLTAPRAVMPIIQTAARALSRRFIRSYNTASRIAIDGRQLQWHTALQSVRVLIDVAQWRAAGTIDHHAGHPWLTMEAALHRGLATSA
jgi:aminoglycoside phosphotransferase (APT) family kinase protein